MLLRHFPLAVMVMLPNSQAHAALAAPPRRTQQAANELNERMAVLSRKAAGDAGAAEAVGDVRATTFHKLGAGILRWVLGHHLFHRPVTQSVPHSRYAVPVHAGSCPVESLFSQQSCHAYWSPPVLLNTLRLCALVHCSPRRTLGCPTLGCPSLRKTVDRSPKQRFVASRSTRACARLSLG